MTWFFTGCLHLGHEAIIEHCKRPFKDVAEMNKALMTNWNSVVGKKDKVVVAGDFCLNGNFEYVWGKFVKNLNGNKIFIKGNHDKWLKEKRFIYEKKIEGQFIVVSHYPFRSWNKSIHGSWNLYSHPHGKMEPLKNQWDVSVDNNNFYPISFEQIKEKINGNMHCV